jgi:hypothetical protein
MAMETAFQTVSSPYLLIFSKIWRGGFTRPTELLASILTAE